MMSTGQDDSLILVVDDDPVTRIRVRSALEENGFGEIREAADGLEAQEFIETHREVDLVLTDIMMPGVDGIDLLRWGREHMPDVAWILLSGFETFDVAVEAIRLGAYDFLAKPPGIEELQVAVKNALERRRLLQERDRLYTELEDTNNHLLSKVRELEDKSELLRRDLQRAEVIQRALLPTNPPSIERFCIQTVYRPGHYVGGDLYDVVRLGEQYLGIYVADATGHGVTSAMLSVLYKQRLRLTGSESGRPLPPSVVLEEANRALLEAVRAPGLFLTAVYCLLDTVSGEMTIASAGHPPALHVRAGGEMQLIQKTGPALGLAADAVFEEEHIQLEADDRFVLYTDGLFDTDQSSSISQLHHILSRRSAGAADVLRELTGIAADPDDATDDEDRDDVTILLLDVHAGPSLFDNGAAESSERVRRPGAPARDVVFYGEGDDASFLALRGRAIWTACDALYETAKGLLERGYPLVLDLSECDYLDSTCLGTIHELVSRGGVQVQGVKPEVSALFEELSMDRVLASIGEPRVLPEMSPLGAPPVSEATGPLRILRAHEALAALSVRNKEKFQDVVDALRNEASKS